jgi:ferritin-like metal-binding protein YciE
MKGLIAEGDEVGKEDGSEAGIDAALIAAAQKVEHYEISAYGTAKALAKRVGAAEVVKLLEATLEEEKETDETLTDISLNEILPELDVESGEEDEEDAA